MYFGWCTAALTGAVLPTFVWLLGDIMDAFGEATTFEETESQIIGLVKYIIALLIFVLVGGYAY